MLRSNLPRRVHRMDYKPRAALATLREGRSFLCENAILETKQLQPIKSIKPWGCGENPHG